MKLTRAMAIVGSLSTVSALLLQYVLLVRLTWDGIGPALATVQFFSYFTILSNLLVAIVLGFAAFCASPGNNGFLASARVKAAVALYITVTGCIYLFVLSPLWAPQGLQWLADVALHYLVPVIYLTWWMTGVRHGSLVWLDAFRWLAFPLAFLLWVLIRGAWLNVYPYPFIDVSVLGAGTVAVNSVGICVLFVVIGCLLITIDRWLGRAQS
ncbi:MAG TPA: Pr6Pr family membrane protein [Dokdonella sp.]|uniref:Pr6Pr family membrane protein n=1 Tax=Dokdonella sp. TaxID=2291710 RepID=UPI002D7F32CD|nr:Pr6Pr family membrane protein [Dokdonella sp.]HET9031682.1 Pr6Pr family membrane protein [Dokdonella sp.]